MLFDHLHATAFQHTPLGRSILGLSENIQNMTKADLQAYIKTHYSAGRMVVVGAGAVDHESFVKMAEKVHTRTPFTWGGRRFFLTLTPAAGAKTRVPDTCEESTRSRRAPCVAQKRGRVGARESSTGKSSVGPLTAEHRRELCWSAENRAPARALLVR